MWVIGMLIYFNVLTNDSDTLEKFSQAVVNMTKLHIANDKYLDFKSVKDNSTSCDITFEQL